MPEPLRWPESPELVFHILSNAGGALVIFGVLVFYYRTLLHAPITADENETYNFISTKKAIALLLLAVFIVLGIHHMLATLHAEHPPNFFATFYTVLVFCDILIVLVSMRYCHAFPVVFRNSGFALATVVLRLALAAPDYTNAALGVGAALYILGLNWVYNQFGATIVGASKENESDHDPHSKAAP